MGSRSARAVVAITRPFPAGLGAWFRQCWALAAARRLNVLAADAAFWAVFSLPWCLLALTTGLGVASPWFGGGVRRAVETDMVLISQNLLGDQAAERFAVPVIHEVFMQERAGVGLVGLVIALYAGSRAATSFVTGVAVLTDSPRRPVLHQRWIGLLLYVGALAVTVLGLSLMTIGTDRADSALSVSIFSTVGDPLLALALTVLLIMWLYYVGTSPRLRLRQIAGAAVIALGLYVLCCAAFYCYLWWQHSRGSSAVGLLVAPVAVMLLAYLLSWSTLAAAAGNAVRLHIIDFAPETDVGQRLVQLTDA